MDVQKTLDGGLVIHHDYIIDLHTDISGRIYDMTEGELKDLDFGSWKDVAYKDEKIATLAEAPGPVQEHGGLRGPAGNEIYHGQRPGFCVRCGGCHPRGRHRRPTGTYFRSTTTCCGRPRR